MNSFEKTFQILEHVVLQCGRPVTPGETAAACGLNAVTCTRLMVSLAERGYLERVSRRAGYVAGPMTVSLQTRRSAYTRLAEVSRRPLAELARRIDNPVNLSVLCKNERVMIVCESPRRDWRPWDTFRFSEEYDTAATARLLGVFLSGEPTGISARERKKILAEKRVEFTAANGLVILGHLITAAGFPPAAFGFGVKPGSDLAAVRTQAASAASSIEAALNPENYTF